MGQRGKVTDISEQATCEICGLTARTKDEIEERARDQRIESLIRTEG